MFRWAKNPQFLWLIIAISICGNLYFVLEREMFPRVSGNKIEGVNPGISDEYENKNVIRVSTYNIRRAKGGDNPEGSAIDAIVDLLRTDDIVGLQEVLGESIGGKPDQARQIGEKVNSGWLFAPAQTRFNRVYTGNALLSKIPIEDWQILPLLWSDTSDQSKQSKRHRNLIQANLRLAGKEVVVFITHIDRGTIRQDQLTSVLKLFDKHPYAILLGDLNTGASERVIADWIQTSGATDIIKLIGKPTDEPFRIDWILTKGFTFVDGGSHPRGLSDHPYYWAEIEIGK